MFDYIVTFFLVLLGALLAMDSFKKWRSLRIVWHLLAVLLFLTAAIFMFYDWGAGAASMVAGLIVYLVGQGVSRRKVK